jgi:glycosyltransferase involved in cell wall biosynthesis
MFSHLVHGALPYDPPWEREGLDDRLAALQGDRPRIAWLYEKPDTSTYRYRVYNMVEGLRADRSQRASAAWFELADVPSLMQRLPEIDTLVVARVRYDHVVARLIAAARAHGVRVLFDCDDLVFDTRYVHLVLDTLAQDAAHPGAWDWWFAYMGRIEATARLCDGGIATNDYLAERMREVVPGPVAIVPNFLNRRQQEVSDTLLTTKRMRRFVADGPVTIGYFSGTPSHNHDFSIVVGALCRLLERDPDVHFRIVGFMDDIGALASFGHRVERLPLHDWVNLQRLIAEVEVNIAPLQENVFTNCKSELKFFEAAAVGTWTVATPTTTFAAAMEGEGAGRLCRAHDWDAALEEAVALARTPQRYAAAAETNADAVRDRYGWNRFADSIVEATLAHA